MNKSTRQPLTPVWNKPGMFLGVVITFALLFITLQTSVGAQTSTATTTQTATPTATPTRTPSPTPTPFPCNAEPLSNLTYSYTDVNRWTPEVLQVYQETGVPANVIKAIMWVESNGRLNARSALTSSGYYFGLMQIGNYSAVPTHMKEVMWMCDNAYNQVLAGGTELVNKSVAIHTTQWDLVAGAYFGYGTDVNGTTTNEYMNRFRTHVDNFIGTTPGAADWELPPTPTPAPTQVADPINYATGSIIKVGNYNLNVRLTPGYNGSKTGKLAPHTEVTVLDGPVRLNNLDWYKIETSSGSTGWVAGQYTTLVSASANGTPTGTTTSTPTASPTSTGTPVGTVVTSEFTPGDPIVVDVFELNLRDAADIHANRIAILPEGAKGVVTGPEVHNGNYDWIPVTMEQFGSGWVAQQYVKRGEGPTSTLTPTPSVTPTPSNTPTATLVATSTSTPTKTATSTSIPGGWQTGDPVIVDVELLNMRSSYGYSGEVIAQLPRNANGLVTGPAVFADGLAWNPVNMAGFGPGWAASDYFKRGVGPTVSLTPTPTYTASATSTSTPTSTPSNTATNTATSTWTPVSGGFDTGDPVVVDVGTLNLRSDHNLDASVLGKLPRGTTGMVTGPAVFDDGLIWNPVNMSGFGPGWVASKYMNRGVGPTASLTPTPTNTSTPTSTQTFTATPTPTQTATSTNTATASSTPTTVPGGFATGDPVIVDVNSLNMRAAPDLHAEILAKLPRGTNGVVTGPPVFEDDLVWNPVSMNGFGSGWVASKYMIRGVGPTASLTPTATATLTETPAPTNTATETSGTSGTMYRVDVAALNLRDTPSLGGGVVAKLSRGDLITNLGPQQSADGHEWIQVDSSYGTGWVASDYLKEVDGSPTSTATATATSTPEGTYGIGAEIMVFEGPLNFRAQPGTSQTILAQLPIGTQGTVQAGPVTADGFEWYQILTDAYGSGWVAEDFIAPLGVAAALEPDSSAPEVTATQTLVPEATEAAEPTTSASETVTVEGLETATAVDTQTSTAEPDTDLDGVADSIDSCPTVANIGSDWDADGVDDACDPIPTATTIPVYDTTTIVGADGSYAPGDTSASEPIDLSASVPVGGGDGWVGYFTFWIDDIGNGSVIDATLVLPVASGEGSIDVAVAPQSAIDEASIGAGVVPAGAYANSGYAAAGSEISISLTGSVVGSGPVTVIVSSTSPNPILLSSRETGWSAYLLLTIQG